MKKSVRKEFLSNVQQSYQLLCSNVVIAMRLLEEFDDLDPDGVPLSVEYDKLGYILAYLRSINEFKDIIPNLK